MDLGIGDEFWSIAIPAKESRLIETSMNITEVRVSLRDDAKLCVMGDVLEQHETPHILFEDPGEMMDWLRDLRETRPGDDLRWWEV